MKYNKRARENGTTDLEKLHLVLLEMLKVIDTICRKNNLQYWLDAGNLLGYARHKGFIPWDDDVDLCMPRQDYEKFIEIAPDQLPEDLFFQYRKLDSKKRKWVKIRDNYSTVVMSYEQNKEVNHHQGIFVDIFPYDVLEEKFNNTKAALNRRFQKSSYPFLQKTKWILNPLFTIPTKLIGMDRMKKYYIKKHEGAKPKHVSIGFEISNLYFTFDYDTVFPLQEIDFLGVKVFSPNNIDKYLSDMYGDYMKTPKEKDQISHAISILPFQKCNHAKALDY